MSFSYLPLKDAISILISTVALIVSGYALWITQFNRGRLVMTQPNLLHLMRGKQTKTPRIFMRMLLFTTGTKGLVIEAMFVRVHHAGCAHTFDFWGCTAPGQLTLGSGLFVGPAGVAYDHHFHLRRGSDSDLLFDAGEYRIEVFATVVRQKDAVKLMETTISVDGDQAAHLVQINSSELFLSWNVYTRKYEGHIELPPM